MTAPAAAPTVLQRLGLGDFDHEMQSTRRLLERVPEDRLDWRPHAKSATLGGLASHLPSILVLQELIVSDDDLDFLSGKFVPLPAATSSAELLSQFDGMLARVRAAIAGVADEGAWYTPWALRRGEHVITQLPKFAAFRAIGMNHLVHHRGQLSVYLRLLDVPVPGMYGPSADEP